MMSSSSTEQSAFQRLWATDEIRDKILAHSDRNDLAKLRLVNSKFARQATAHTFKSITITFSASTFTKPARLAALKRIGQYVRRVKFFMPYNYETMLPPLLEPTTGTEVEFVYTPDCEIPKPELSHSRLIGQTDEKLALSELLIKQYPPLYHAAVNVPSFIKAFSCLPNLKSLAISCPSEDSVIPSTQSIVDYALISLRVAVERSSLPKLDHLTLSPVQAHVIKLLNPVFGPGARPDSLRRWRQIKSLTINMPMTSATTQLKQLHSYLHALSPNLTSFVFHWLPPIVKPSSASRMSIARKPLRPSSTGTSYFPTDPPPQTFHRGANPLTLHLSSFLQPRTPTQKASAHSLPSMSSASTLRSASSGGSASSSCQTTPSTSPARQPRVGRPNLRCQPTHSRDNQQQRPSSSGSTSSASSVPGLSPSSSPVSSPLGGNGMRPLALPKLAFFSLDSISCAASEIAAFIDGHARHLSEFRLEHTTLEPGGGDWDDALAPLSKLAGHQDGWRDQKHKQKQKQKPKQNKQSPQQREQCKTAPRPRTPPPKAIAICPPSSSSGKNKARYEEVPIFLGPELSSPVDLSPVRIAGIDAPLSGTTTTVLNRAHDLAVEIGLDRAHDMVAELPLDDETAYPDAKPQARALDLGACPPARHRQYTEDPGRLSLSFGLPGVEPSPMIGSTSALVGGQDDADDFGVIGGEMQVQLDDADDADRQCERERCLSERCKRGHYGADITMHARAQMIRNALVPSDAQARRNGQKELEDGVRKLLAQTVFPWF